jgi:hypothetical protein
MTDDQARFNISRRAIQRYANNSTTMFIIHMARHLGTCLKILDSRITKLEEAKQCCCSEKSNAGKSEADSGSGKKAQPNKTAGEAKDKKTKKKDPSEVGQTGLGHIGA